MNGFINVSKFGIVLFILGVIVCILVFLSHKRYLKLRLAGEGKIRNFPQPLIIILSLLLIFSFIFNIYLGSEISSHNRKYNQLAVKTHNNSIIINDFSISEYSQLKQALVNNNLPGYEVTRQTQNDFECISAKPIGKITGLPFMPQYLIYVNYFGPVLANFQMERYYYYNQDHNGHGSRGSFKPETMIIGNTYEANYYIAVKTIIKVASQDSQTKQNWDSIPIYQQSFFAIN